MKRALATVLEARFRQLNELLYDTRVPVARLEREVFPHLGEDVLFVDPWQEGRGRERYRLGAAGFHAMLSFTFQTYQVSVQLAEDGRRGRAMIDGVMKLTPLGPQWMYPLRTQLVYEFRVLRGSPTDAHFLIDRHEEMWSLGDMLAAVPGVGWVYQRLFRPAFCRGFLAASYVACRARAVTP